MTKHNCISIADLTVGDRIYDHLTSSWVPVKSIAWDETIKRFVVTFGYRPNPETGHGTQTFHRGQYINTKPSV